jgi:3'(2'), 5'-bisphosphate nucleotidase
VPDSIRPPAFVDRSLMAALTELALLAAQAIMRLRETQLGVRAKPDCSPVTAADEASEAILLEGLARLMPGIVVVSEEQDRHVMPAPGATFVLVDPLDGTREFIAGRDEFVVALGIIADGAPVAGILAAPARQLLWRGVVGRGAERLASPSGRTGEPERIRTREWPGDSAAALVSRSHLDGASAALLDRLHVSHRQPCGSALKFCLLAEGSADIYPRLAPTSAWDVAAGHALLTAAGGTVVHADATPLLYGEGESSLRVADFCACGDPKAVARLA